MLGLDRGVKKRKNAVQHLHTTTMVAYESVLVMRDVRSMLESRFLTEVFEFEFELCLNCLLPGRRK